MRRKILLIAISSLSLLLASCTQRGEDKYPNRLIELIVPWAAGGGSDRVARFLADELQRKLGQPVVVVNRTGGSGAVGHSAGALAPPDGYTLTLATFELSTMKSMGISKLTWNDFTPVAQVNADAAAIFVRNDAPWKTLPELLEHIRKNPGKLKMSGTSTGGAWDLARSGLLLAAGIEPSSVIWSPTQGSAPALVELLGGHVEVVCCSLPEAWSQLEARQIRALAALSPSRVPDFPDVPTAIEQSINYLAVGWRGIMLPKSAPAKLTDQLAAALDEICASDSYKSFMKKNGFAIEVKKPMDFQNFLVAEEKKWGDVIQNAGYSSIGKNHDPGTNLFPAIIGFGLLLVTTAEVFRTRRAPAPKEPTAGDNKFVWKISAGFVAYLILMPRIGFVPTTFLFAAAAMILLGINKWKSLIASAVIVGVIYLMFVQLFKVQLP